MSSFFSTVSILHCGGDEEVHFIQYLEQALSSFPGGPSFVLEYTEFQKDQTKEVVMFHDAQKYKKNKVPLIVLISKEFFNLVWLTTHKAGILSAITNHSTINCLHIWMDVSEEDVKRRSNGLLRTDGYFRRKKVFEFTTKLTKPDMVNNIYSLLSENGDGKFNPLNNYDVDDEVEEMRQTFYMLSAFATEPPPPPDISVTAPEPPKKPVNKKKDLYKNAMSLANRSPEEIEALNRDSNYHSESSASSVTKKRKKKKKTAGGVKLMTEISDVDITNIAQYLDKGPGANWKQLAECFRLGNNIIQNISDNVPDEESHTEQLIHILQKEKPELEVTEFMHKCRTIFRYDVQDYMKDNVLS